MNLAELSWPPVRLGEGIEELARRTGLGPAAGEALAVPDAVLGGTRRDLADWLDWAGRHLGIEVQPVETTVPELGALVMRAAPAILTIASDDGPRFLLVTQPRLGRPRVLGPDLEVHDCAVETITAALCAPYEGPLAGETEHLLQLAGIAQRRRGRVRSLLMRERLAGQRIGDCWMLRLPAGAGFARQLAREGIPMRGLAMLLLFAALYGCEIFGWVVIGDAALNGRVDLAWLGAWVLLVFSMIPLRLLGAWVRSTLALDLSALLKTRLLAGALRLDADGVRHQGVGQLLGRVMESQALEALAVNGGLGALVAIIELGFAVWILGSGSGGALHVALLVLWLAAAVALAWRYYRRLAEWTALRLRLTHDLVEQMVGHRTRLAQEWQERRDRDEDHAMKDYLAASGRMDRAIMPVLTGIPSGWMLIGLAGMVPGFVTGSAGASAFAIALGGVLLAGRAFGGLADGLASAARAAIAWKQAGPLFHAAATSAAATPFVPRTRPAGYRAPPLIQAEGVSFRYADRGERVLRDVEIVIAPGEHILLEGGSGGGKSTLASLLAGLRQPDSGLLLLNGLDRHTLGDAWHQIATEAPQFHENHIFTASLAFNLLMGRNWPAREDELKEAQQLCIELGLGDLLARMPAGIMQTVGETGWQLSHGERSRIFLARALLQGAPLTILDESFAALDPETLKASVECALRRAQTLMVVAHP